MTRLHAGLVLVCAVATFSCAGSQRARIPDTVGPTVVAPSNLFLRSSFDADPTIYAGRFVPEGVAVPDETAAMRMTCSEHLHVTRIDGGGVQYDELFNANSDAALRVGVPLVASATVGATSAAVVRVKYELTEKMVVSASDPAAFEACCKAAADQCTATYIGEFIAGKGSVFYAASHGGGVKADGIHTSGASGDLEVKGGVAWQRSVEFPNPVFFAFKTTTNPWVGTQAGGCGDWVGSPPRSTLGQYFVGISQPRQTEADARDTALSSGRAQVVRYVAESIESGSISTRGTSGATDALSARLDEETFVRTASEGVARRVKDEAWCVEPEATPGGTVYVAKVLMFLPKDALEPAAEAILEAAAP